jgi:hypothetical protein
MGAYIVHRYRNLEMGWGYCISNVLGEGVEPHQAVDDTTFLECFIVPWHHQNLKVMNHERFQSVLQTSWT